MSNNYFDFLCNLVARDNKDIRLLDILHGMEYYALIPNDDNRAEDGKQLRERFADEEGLQALSLCPNNACTVLEMLIGLSFRLEFETAQSQWEKTPAEWFWILLDNLDLVNARLDPDGGIIHGARKDDIINRVGIFLDRQYDANGNGGLFPLRRPKKDQRKVEIWYQMSAYMLENYPI